MKAFTDLEQSKKLAEILPPESADMCWTNHYYGPLRSSITISAKSIDEYKNLLKNFADLTEIDVFYPAWSLASLLNVLPNSENISTNLSKGGYRISTLEYTNSWFVDYEDATDGLNNCVTSADNPVDACVEMIERLHELNLL